MKLFLLLLFVATAGHAAAPVPLTLEQAITEAQNTNPELRAAQAGIAAARGAVTSANARPNPELHFTEGIDRHIGIEQTFEWPGKRVLRRALAEKNVTAAEVALDGLRQTIAANIRKLFSETLAAQQTLAARQQAVALAEQLLAAAARRVSAGVAGSFEKTKAELELVRTKMELRKAEGEAATARAALAVTLGREAGAPLAVNGALPAALPDLKLDAVLTVALARHPDLRSQAALIAARDAAVPVARASAKPDVRIEPFFEQSTFTKTEKTAGVGVAVPLPIWNRNTGEIRQAQAEAEKTRAELDKERRRITEDIATAFTAFQAAREQLALWRPDLVKELGVSIEKAAAEYRGNRISAAMLLELQRSYFEAVRDGTEVQLQAARAAAALERAALMPLNVMEKP